MEFGFLIYLLALGLGGGVWDLILKIPHLEDKVDKFLENLPHHR